MDGDVERSGRLIGNQQSRLARKGDSDGDTLTLPPRELMRVFIDAPVWCRNADLPQQFDGACTGLGAAHTKMLFQDLSNLSADRHHRVQ